VVAADRVVAVVGARVARLLPGAARGVAVEPTVVLGFGTGDSEVAGATDVVGPAVVGGAVVGGGPGADDASTRARSGSSLPMAKALTTPATRTPSTTTRRASLDGDRILYCIGLVRREL